LTGLFNPENFKIMPAQAWPGMTGIRVKKVVMKQHWKPEYGEKLVRVVRAEIVRKLNPSALPSLEPDLSEIPDSLLEEKRGVFVTLHKNGRLRGCIGNIEPAKPVLEGVRENALHAALDDARFAPVTPEELADLDIEVSLLTVPEKLDYSDSKDLLRQIVPFRHGVIVEKGHHRATFLPQVWEQLPDPASLLTQLCLKARLDPDAWRTRDLTVSIYEVQSFTETGKPHGH
jgi:AmmeMemoRadiSam system protein A